MTDHVQFNDGTVPVDPHAPENEQEARDRAEYEAWRAEKARQSEDKPAEVKQQDVVSTGRKTAPTEVTKSEVRTPESEEEEATRSYVWLANGEVVLCENDDLPQHAGIGAELGYWENDGKVHSVVAVYPQEVTIKEGK